MLRPALLAALLLGAPAPAQAQGQTGAAVDLELILMADGSGSIDEQEFSLQRLGYAHALRDPRVIDAIRNGPIGAIALSYVEWSGPALHVPIVPWTLIRAPADAAAFARQLEQQPRALYSGGTALGDAILYGIKSIRDNGFTGRRRVIDLSGDGPDRNGLPAAIGRDAAIAAGITVNGLPILIDWPGLDLFFRSDVIGGRGAFVISANTFKDFGLAVRKKIIREIAGLPANRPLAPETHFSAR